MTRRFTQSPARLLGKAGAVILSIVLALSFLPIAALSGPSSHIAWADEPVAFAVYDANTKTLSFHKQSSVPEAGSTFVGNDGVQRTASCVYEGIETTQYGLNVGGANVPVPWNETDSPAKEAESAVFVDVIAPISTASWFAGKTNLVNLDIAKLDTSNATNLSGMFANCSSLTTLDLSHFNTSNATDIRGLCLHCSSLTSVDLTSFDTSKVEYMNTMFNGCSSLTVIDLSSFDTSNVKLVASMFNECSSLTTVYAGEKWNLQHLSQTTLTPVFDHCYNIVGGLGTTYDNSKKNIAYLHIDGGELYPGYLSAHKKLIGSCEITGVEDSYFYRGDPITPKPTITENGVLLQEGVDYSLNFQEEPKYGKATLTITGIGDFEGYIVKTYRLVYGAPSIIKGENSKWTPKSGTPLVVSSEAPLEQLQRVEVDGNTIEEGKDYTATSGSTVIQLTDSFLKTLSDGDHEISIVSEGGTASTTFSVEGSEDDPDDPDPAKPDPNDPENPGSDDGPGDAASSVAIHRLYNPNSGEHFFTASKAESDHLDSVGWDYEGVAWASPKEGQAVYRMYNPNAGDHHYTTSEAEAKMLKSVGWNDEGIAFYSAEKDAGIAIYRQYNPNAIAGAHHFTIAKKEYDFNNKLGWQAEGVAWYAVDDSAKDDDASSKDADKRE